MQSAVVLLNVLAYFDPLRQLIQNGVTEGYINASNELVVFVDGPALHEEHENFDWGKAGLEAIDAWQGNHIKGLFDWKLQKDGSSLKEDNLGAS